MFKVKYIPQYFLLFLLLILTFFEGWTYYLGTTPVTFKRLVGKEVYKEIDDISLRRYKENYFSAHLFKIKSKEESRVIQRLKIDCNTKAITKKELPKEAKEVDAEMVDVIEKSPYVYLSKKYDLAKPNDGRMCLIFRDKESIYLFMNGNLK